MIHLRIDSPYRPVDWRWEKARQLRASGRYVSRTRDDQFVAKAKQFQTEHARCANDWDKMELLGRWPGLFDAHEIKLHSQPHTRYELEARLLARPLISYEDIAAKLGVDRTVVAWYEALFFNVRDRMTNETWITHQVMGPAIFEAISERDVEQLWKWFAFGGGVHVLDAVVSAWTNPIAPESASGVGGFMTTQSQHIVNKKTCVSMLTLRCSDAYTKLQLGELYARLKDVENQAGQASGGDGITKEAVVLALRAMPWGVGLQGNGATHVANLGPAQDYDKGPAELRAAQLLSLRAGGEVVMATPPAYPKPKEGTS